MPTRHTALQRRAVLLDYAGEHVGGEAWCYLERRGGCAEALAAMRDASHYTRGRLSREAVHTLYGRSITLSASRMDKARSCHFAYFMQYGLRAKERTAAGFDAPQVGTFVHDVMGAHAPRGERARRPQGAGASGAARACAAGDRCIH